MVSQADPRIKNSDYWRFEHVGYSVNAGIVWLGYVFSDFLFLFCLLGYLSIVGTAVHINLTCSGFGVTP